MKSINEYCNTLINAKRYEIVSEAKINVDNKGYYYFSTKIKGNKVYIFCEDDQKEQVEKDSSMIINTINKCINNIIKDQKYNINITDISIAIHLEPNGLFRYLILLECNGDLKKIDFEILSGDFFNVNIKK